MQVLIGKKDSTRSILIGETESDKKVLRFLYDNSICWGYYCIWERHPDNRGANDPKIKAILEKFPTATAVGFFHSPKGFVPPYHKVDLSKIKEEKKEEKNKQEQAKLFNFLEDTQE